MHIQTVPARAGLQWIKSGLRTFWRQPLSFAALFILIFACNWLVNMLPYVGFVLAMTLMPCTTVAAMVATDEVARGPIATWALLRLIWRSVRQRMRDLLLLGGLCAATSLALLGLTACIDGGTFASVILRIAPMRQEFAYAAPFQSAMLLAAALSPPLAMLLWHAPGLTHWHSSPPAKALFFSLLACLRNWGAHMVFIMVWLGIGMALTMVAVLGIILAYVLGAPVSALTEPMAINLVIYCNSILIAALVTTSMVFTFRDNFHLPHGQDASATQP